ncbi:bacteriocin immunity protein [Carnobacterium sp. CS13]|uniref:bacteriocin immunity protein n=1 Tax=Carnobacterium sp. CS13 TaxID=2800128 RepID=UPI001912DCA0|nr:bacteriocin immunity protein [Carnobacterium sp. CS13]QQP70176.1 bacteriocin immunity protein [Carnobacterium sp. CS13]
MKNKSKQIVHDFYNSIDQSNMGDIKEVLLKVYTKLDDSKENAPLINRLVNFIYFTGFHQKLHFKPEQESMIRKLSKIGQNAGLNGVYRSSYGDKTQF